MSHSVTVTRTFWYKSSTGTAPRLNGGHLSSGPGVVQIAETVLGAVAVGLLAYYGNRYYDDVEARTAEWVLLVLKNVLKTEQLDMWKPITFFLAVASACLMNTLCLLVACLLSYSTASTIPKTIYGILYHFLAFALYLSASVTLIVKVHKPEIQDYKNGFYYEPFLAAGIIGVIVSAFYLLSTALSYRSYRGTV